MPQIANNNATLHLRRVYRLTTRFADREWIDPPHVFDLADTTNEFDEWYRSNPGNPFRGWARAEEFDIYSLIRNLREATFDRELPSTFITPFRLATLIHFELESPSRNRNLVHPNQTLFYVSPRQSVVMDWKPRHRRPRLDMRPRAANLLCPKDSFIVVPLLG